MNLNLIHIKLMCMLYQFRHNGFLQSRIYWTKYAFTRATDVTVSQILSTCSRCTLTWGDGFDLCDTVTLVTCVNAPSNSTRLFMKFAILDPNVLFVSYNSQGSSSGNYPRQGFVQKLRKTLTLTL